MNTGGPSPKALTFLININMSGIHWKSQHVQTVFPKPNIKYFRVTMPLTMSVHDHDDQIKKMLKLAKLKDERDFQERNTIVAAEASRVEWTPLLNRAGWLRMFVGRDMKILSEATSEKVAEGESLSTIKTRNWACFSGLAGYRHTTHNYPQNVNGILYV